MDNMLYLNNELLTSDRIIAYFEENLEKLNNPAQGPGPSELTKLKNKLKAIFFPEQAKPSDDAIQAILTDDDRFKTNYPRLKQILYQIFALNDTDDKTVALKQLKTINDIDWNTDTARDEFNQFNKKYGYFPQPSEVLYQFFTELALACRTQIVLFEKNNTEEDTRAYDYAYKLMALFITDPTTPPTSKPALSTFYKNIYTLMNNISGDKMHAFHEVLLVALNAFPPANEVSDKAGWQKLMIKEGIKAIPFFMMAEKIEHKIEEKTQERKKRAPETLEEAKWINTFCTYTRADEDEEFAKLCKRYNVSEYRFNRCLDYLSAGNGWPKKQADTLPDITIVGTGDATDLYWVKLPVTDKRGLILGDITNCCQSIGGHSEPCVKDAASLNNNALYVLVKALKKNEPLIVNGEINDKDFKIIGQSYAWKSVTGNICLDSMECLAGEVTDSALRTILSDFSKQVLENYPNIRYVNLGIGGKTLIQLFSNATISEKILQGYQYADSFSQYCIAQKPSHRSLSPEQHQELKTLLQPYKTMVDCFTYLIDYLDDPVDSIIERLKTLLEETKNQKSLIDLIYFDERILMRLLSINPHPSIQDLMPVDWRKLKRLTPEQKTNYLKDISVTRLTWTGSKYRELLSIIPYLSEDQFLGVIKIKDTDGVSLLAYTEDNVDCLSDILNRLPESLRWDTVMSKANDGKTLWHLAAKNPEWLATTLSSFSKPIRQLEKALQEKDYAGRTTWHFVANHPESLAMLFSSLSKPPSDNELLELVQQQDKWENTILHYAQHPEIFVFILTKLPKYKRFDVLMMTNYKKETPWNLVKQDLKCLGAILTSLTKDMSKEECLTILQKKDLDGSPLLNSVAKDPAIMTSMLNSLDISRRFETVMLTDTQNKTVLHRALEGYPTSYDALIAILNTLPESVRFDAIMLSTIPYPLPIFLTLLDCIPEENRLELIKHSGICKSETLTPKITLEILNKLPISQRFDVLNIPDKYGHTQLERLYGYPYKSDQGLVEIIQCLPENHQAEALKASTILESTKKQDWIEWIKHFEKNQRLPLVTCKSKHGHTILTHLAQVPGDLTKILEEIPEAQHCELAKSIGVSLHDDNLALSLRHCSKILKSLPADLCLDIVMVRNSKGETILDRLKDEDYIDALAAVPIQRRFDLILHKNTEHKTIYDRCAKRYYSNIINLLPPEQRFDAAMIPNHAGETVCDTLHDPDNIIEFLNVLPESQQLKAVMTKNQDGQTLLLCLKRPPLFDGKPDYIISMLRRLPESDRLTAVMDQNKDGETLLHFSGNLEYLDTILESYPKEKLLDAIMLKDAKDNTALHYYSHNLDCLKKIISIYPETQQLNAIKKENRQNITLLHKTASYPKSLSFILQCYPADQQLEAVAKKDALGRTALHYAANTPESLKLILQVCPEDQQLEAIIEKDTYNRTVLHYAARTPESLKFLLESYPINQINKRVDAMMAKDKDGKTAFHFAATTLETLNILLSFYPTEHWTDAVMAKDNNSQTVLHHATKNPACFIALWNILSKDKRSDVIDTLNDVIINHGAEILEATTNLEQVTTILNCIPLAQRFDVVMMKGQYKKNLLQKVTQNPGYIPAILSCLSEEEQLKAVKMSGLLHEVCWNKERLFNCLHSLPQGLRFDALLAKNDTGHTVWETIYDEAQLSAILESLPESKRFDAIAEQSKIFNKIGLGMLKNIMINKIETEEGKHAQNAESSPFHTIKKQINAAEYNTQLLNALKEMQNVISKELTKTYKKEVNPSTESCGERKVFK